MKSRIVTLVAAVSLGVATPATAGTWTSSVPFTNAIGNAPFQAGGYAGYDPGATAPNPGSCLDSERSRRGRSRRSRPPGTASRRPGS